MLYAVIWLAIGSNLLVKSTDSIYYGMTHMQLLKSAPLEALRTGLEYMLSTPYIQSVGRKEFSSGFYTWLIGVFNQLLPGGAYFLIIICAFGVALGAVYAFLSLRQKQDKRLFIAIYLFTGPLVIAVMLYIQATLPYNRVFSFFGVLLSILIAFILSCVVSGKNIWLSRALMIFFVFFSLTHLLSSYYNRPLGEREDAIADAIDGAGVDISTQTVFPTDDYQQYVLNFYFGDEYVLSSEDEAALILYPKSLKTDGDSAPEWPDLYTAESFPKEKLSEMIAIYENDFYITYIMPK